MTARSSNASVGRRTRGGWTPVGTAASRRAKTKHSITPKGAQTRSMLVAAARRVFESQGYLEARVPDIVAEAGLAQGSFYTYFHSKREIFQEISTTIGEEITAAATINTDHAHSPIERLAYSIACLFEAYKRNAKMFTLIEQVATIDPVVHAQRLAGRRRHVDRISRNIQHLQERGIAYKDIDPQVTAGALVSMVSNFSYWLLSGGDSNYEEEFAIGELTKIWARALGIPGPENGSDYVATADAPRGNRSLGS
jgi:AcrR family transcriptional regulator